MEFSWNPWHGCRKLSSGCKNCYVFRTDAKHGKDSAVVTKNKDFNLPIKLDRKGNFSVPSGSLIDTCFTSDFFLEDADEWRKLAWEFIKKREDVNFFMITKRIDRFEVSLPSDWGDGYENVAIGCTCENQEMADLHLPIFLSAPIKHKTIICSPLLESIDITPYLQNIEEVGCGGESGENARVCNLDWVKDIRQQCVDNDIAFYFHQTGAKLIVDGKLFSIDRKFQHSQAYKSGLNYKHRDMSRK